MSSPAAGSPQRDAFVWTLNALVAPWRLGQMKALDRRRTAFYAAANVILAAALATLLST